MIEFWYGLLDLLLPRRCILCHTIVPSRPRPVPICEEDWSMVERVSAPVCRFCARPVGSDPKINDGGPIKYPSKSVCGSCRKRELTLEFLLAGFQFDSTLRTIVSDWKYDSNPEWGSWLAKRMKVAVSDQFNQGRWDGLVPLPMYPNRRRDRGFNQAEQLAGGLAQAWDLPMKPVLRKHRRTAPQSSLGRQERLENLQNAFSLKPGVEDLPDRLLLVDDVYTTGATIRTAASVLKDHANTVVGGLVLARTPPDSS
ncbi:MAG: double zinc ribbon domain-containing protein [bacterium]